MVNSGIAHSISGQNWDRRKPRYRQHTRSGLKRPTKQHLSCFLTSLSMWVMVVRLGSISSMRRLRKKNVLLLVHRLYCLAQHLKMSRLGFRRHRVRVGRVNKRRVILPEPRLHSGQKLLFGVRLLPDTRLLAQHDKTPEGSSFSPSTLAVTFPST